MKKLSYQSTAGWRVAISARRADRLEETAKLCTGPVLTVVGDVSKEADVDKLFETTISSFGALDFSIHVLDEN